MLYNCFTESRLVLGGISFEKIAKIACVAQLHNNKNLGNFDVDLENGNQVAAFVV